MTSPYIQAERRRSRVPDRIGTLFGIAARPPWAKSTHSSTAGIPSGFPWTFQRSRSGFGIRFRFLRETKCRYPVPRCAAEPPSPCVSNEARYNGRFPKAGFGAFASFSSCHES
jgi:hypothetical protein